MLLLGLQEFSHSFHGLAPGDDVTVTYMAAHHILSNQSFYSKIFLEFSGLMRISHGYVTADSQNQ